MPTALWITMLLLVGIPALYGRWCVYKSRKALPHPIPYRFRCSSLAYLFCTIIMLCALHIGSPWDAQSSIEDSALMLCLTGFTLSIALGLWFSSMSLEIQEQEIIFRSALSQPLVINILDIEKLWVGALGNLCIKTIGREDVVVLPLVFARAPQLISTLDYQNGVGKVPNTSPPKKYHTARISEVKGAGRPLSAILENLIRLDYRNLADVHACDVGDPESWNPIVRKSPNSMRLLLDSDSNIVGYWHFLPLDYETYKRIKEGKLQDGALVDSDILKLDYPKECHIYFMILCIDKEHRGLCALRSLLQSLRKTLITFKDQGIEVKEVCAKSTTHEGEVFCKKIGMTHYKTLDEKTKIFVLKPSPDFLGKAFKGKT